MAPKRVNGILVLHRHNLAPTASMVTEIVQAFERHSRFETWVVNTHLGFPEALREYEFSVVVLHYSLFATLPFLEPEFRAWLSERPSTYRVAFFQDEYRFWPQRAEALSALRIDCVYTCVEPAHYDETYRRFARIPTVVTYLPGYVGEDLEERAAALAKPDEDRTVDFGYRGRIGPEYLYLGKGAMEKYEIGVRFREMAQGRGLALDIETAEHKRIYGDDWLAFLGNCRVVLGVEAGTSVFDVDDRVISAWERQRADRPEVPPEELYEMLVAPYDGTGIYYRTVSPRVFEAAAAGACQVLFEGKYSGILAPMVHYVPLRKDFSNFEEVLRLCADPGLRRELTENCRRDLIASGAFSYRRFIAECDERLRSAGLLPDAPEDLVHEVDDALARSGRHLLEETLARSRAEYQRLLGWHVSLQQQYLAEQRQLQELLRRAAGPSVLRRARAAVSRRLRRQP